MKCSVNAKKLNAMIKRAAALKPRITALTVHDGKFELFAVTFENTTVELGQWVPVDDVVNADFETILSVEDGVWSVNLKDLAPLKSVQKNADVTIEGASDKVTFRTPGFSFAVKATAGYTDGYTPALRFADPHAEMEILEEDCAGVEFISRALSKDTIRPDFLGASISLGRMVSTDGHRLHTVALRSLIQTGSFTGIMPPEMVKFIGGGAFGKLAEHERHERGLDKWHILEGDGFCMKARCISGRFPDFSKVFPRYTKDQVTDIDVKAFADAIKTVSAGWKASVAVIRRSKDGAEITCYPGGKNKDAAPRTATVPGAGEIFPVAIGFDPAYILDALKGKTGVLQFCWVDMDSPAWFGEWGKGLHGDGAIIMPKSW